MKQQFTEEQIVKVLSEHQNGRQATEYRFRRNKAVVTEF